MNYDSFQITTIINKLIDCIQIRLLLDLINCLKKLEEFPFKLVLNIHSKIINKQFLEVCLTTPQSTNIIYDKNNFVNKNLMPI